MHLRRFKDKKLFVTAGIVVLAALAVVIWSIMTFLSPNHASTTTETTAHDRYAALYQAAWRQDAGRGTTLVTATLLVPPMVEALGADSERSATDGQVWDIVRSLKEHQVPLILTFDSVAAAVPDAVVQAGISLHAAGGPTLTLESWQPMIVPSRIVNTSVSATSQVGVAVFLADQDIDWQQLGTLQLEVRGIGETPVRTLTWAEPKLLLAIDN